MQHQHFEAANIRANCSNNVEAAIKRELCIQVTPNVHKMKQQQFGAERGILCNDTVPKLQVNVQHNVCCSKFQIMAETGNDDGLCRVEWVHRLRVLRRTA